MLKTITTVNQTLKSLLNADEITAAEKNKGDTKKFQVIIFNNAGNNIFVEFGQAATTTGSVPIAATESRTFEVNDLEDCNLIAITGNNTDTRIIIL